MSSIDKAAKVKVKREVRKIIRPWKRGQNDNIGETR